MGNFICNDITQGDLLIIKSKHETIKKLNPKIKKIIFENSSNCEHTKILLNDNLYVQSIDLSALLYHEHLDELPSGLVKLYLPRDYNIIIKTIPKKLEELRCSCVYYSSLCQSVSNNIPTNLKILRLLSLSYNDDKITNMFFNTNLMELEFESDCLITNTVFDNLPNKLVKLKLPDYSNCDLTNLPKSLEYLILGKEHTYNLDMLPESIIFIEFPELSNTSYKLNVPLHNLPHGVEYLNLQFQNKYTESISNLPDTIKYLEIGEYELEIKKLPANLKFLCICTLVQFKYVKNIINPITNKNAKCYELVNIGKFNIENNIQITIPTNLTQITWWDLDSSVYTNVKDLEFGYWIEQ